MFLDYFSLFLLCVSITLVFYTFIYIHELPHKVAKGRDHPHEEAIFVACWLSLFTLHAIWPIVFIWAIAHKRGQPHLTLVSTGGTAVAATVPPANGEATGDLTHRIAALEARLGKIEAGGK